jgi:multiple antibiotic resistance protein
MADFWLCFVPLFVAVNAVGVLPMFMTLTEGMNASQQKRIITQSVIVATIVGLVFLAIGKGVLALLGITVYDFMIAGGSLLFILSVRDLMTYERVRRAVDEESLGAVPLGVPLIVGPAVLATTLLLMNEYGPVLTATALIINIGIAGVVFRTSELFLRVLGGTGAKTVSKLSKLLLAAIAVMMVRRGVEAFLTKFFAAR